MIPSNKIPRDPLANMEYRQDLMHWIDDDPRVQAARRATIIEACSKDIVFWMNTCCLASGTLVVTDAGLVAIEEVSPDHKVWDGESWVSQRGVISQGIRQTISAYGIRLTPDHKVMTNHGWQPAIQGFDRASIRLPNGYRERWNIRKNKAGSVELPVPMWREDSGDRLQSSQWNNQELWLLHGGASGRDEYNSREGGDTCVCRVVWNWEAMQRPQGPSVSPLRRAGDQNLRTVEVVRELPCRHGRATGWNDDREDRQRRELLPRELSVGNAAGAGEQHQTQCIRRNYKRENDDHASRENCWREAQHDTLSNLERAGCILAAPASGTREEAVYDLINCGPRRAFTVIDKNGKPLLVHNCWLLEPRILGAKQTSSKIPFASWIHQDEAITELEFWLGRKDAVISKSRAEGASWLVLMLFLHKWLYRPNSRFGVVSKNEDSAASMEDTDSLMYKLNWQVEQLPPWMRPKRWRQLPSENTLSNYDNGSGITAYACTADAGVGGRKLAIMFDELSRWESGKDYTAWVSNQAVTPCRIAVATPFGPLGQYYDLVHDEDSDILKVRLNWKKNPTKNRGMYRVVEGQPLLLDLRNGWVGDYGSRVKDVLPKLIRKGYNVEEGVRSEWYDAECLRSGATPQSIAQEYDESFTGHSTPYFGDFLLRRLKTESVRPPYKRGTLSYDPETLAPTFREDENGDLLLWVNVLLDKTPPFGKYGAGCDISQGTGGAYSSLSVIVVFDATTGDQVAEFATRTMRPDKFADFAIALSKWFHDAKLGWEGPGPGTQFCNQVIHRSYGHCVKRRVKEEHSSKVTKKLGVNVQGEDKLMLFGGGGTGHEGFYGAVVDGKAIPRSEKLVEECGEYMFKKRNGKMIVVHKSDANKKAGDDDHGKDHGDRVVAAAIAWLACQESGKLDEDTEPKPEEKAPVGSWAWRVQQAKREELELVSELDFE